MKVFITDVYNLAGDSIFRILYSNTDFDLHILSNKIKENFHNKKVTAYRVDYLDIKGVKDIIYKIKPDVIISTYDYGDIYSKEKLKIQTINVQYSELILSISRVLGSKLIGISNEFVFNGRKGQYEENTKAGTENYYGITKHAFENLLLTTIENSALVRHSFLYGHNSFGYSDLSSDLLGKVSVNQEYEIKLDYWTNPVLADEFAQLILKIIGSNAKGIFHAGGTEYLLLSDFAKKLTDFSDYNPELVKNSKSGQELKFGLNSKKTEAQFNINFANLRSGLTAFMNYIYGDSVLPGELF